MGGGWWTEGSAALPGVDMSATEGGMDEEGETSRGGGETERVAAGGGVWSGDVGGGGL